MDVPLVLPFPVRKCMCCKMATVNIFLSVRSSFLPNQLKAHESRHGWRGVQHQHRVQREGAHPPTPQSCRRIVARLV